MSSLLIHSVEPSIIWHLFSGYLKPVRVSSCISSENGMKEIYRLFSSFSISYSPGGNIWIWFCLSISLIFIFVFTPLYRSWMLPKKWSALPPVMPKIWMISGCFSSAQSRARSKSVWSFSAWYTWSAGAAFWIRRRSCSVMLSKSPKASSGMIPASKRVTVPLSTPIQRMCSPYSRLDREWDL